MKKIVKNVILWLFILVSLVLVINARTIINESNKIINIAKTEISAEEYSLKAAGDSEIKPLKPWDQDGDGQLDIDWENEKDPDENTGPGAGSGSGSGQTPSGGATTTPGGSTSPTPGGDSGSTPTPGGDSGSSGGSSSSSGDSGSYNHVYSIGAAKGYYFDKAMKELDTWQESHGLESIAGIAIQSYDEIQDIGIGTVLDAGVNLPLYKVDPETHGDIYTAKTRKMGVYYGNSDPTAPGSRCYELPLVKVMPNVACIHMSSMRPNNAGASRVDAIVDVEPDGTITVTWDGGSSTITDLTYWGKYLACLAYESQYGSTVTYFGEETGWEQAANLLRSVWDREGIREKSGIGNSWPRSSNGSTVNAEISSTPRLKTIHGICDAYANSGEEKYKARVLLIASAGEQDRAVMFGTEGEGTNVKINKYISEVESASGGSVLYSGTERQALTKAAKKTSPYQITSQSTNTESYIVTYTIEITNNGEQEITGDYSDQFSTELHFESGDLSKTGITIKPKETVTFTVKLKVSNTVNENTILENTAYFKMKKDNQEKTFDDSDYFKIKKPNIPPPPPPSTPATGNYEKYITKVLKADGSVRKDYGSSREGLSNADKKADPVMVEKGDTVIYNVHFKTTKGTDCDEDSKVCSISYKDTPGSGLKITQGPPSEHDHEEEFTDVIKAQVTASNLTLGIIENKITNVKATSWEWWCDCNDEAGCSCEHEEDEDPCDCEYKKCYEDNISSNYSSNMDADYVSVMDPEIGGMVWLEKGGDSGADGLKDSSESPFKDIPVELIDESTGAVVASTKTGSNGRFSFGRIQKGNVRTDVSSGVYFYDESGGWKQYHVLYYYFGEKYQATINSGTSNLDPSNSAMNSNFPIDSNADEVDRQAFNNTLETIAYSKAYEGTSGSGDAEKWLTFDKSGHESILQWTDETTMTAKSFTLYHNPKGGPGGSETEYLKNINLGLFERDRADLRLNKDVYSALVTINGFETTYTYDQLSEGELYELTTPYRLRIYREDYEYRKSKVSGTAGNFAGDDLNIEITYKIHIVNESSDQMYAVIRELIDISSNEMTLIRADGSFGTTSSYNIASYYDYGSYNKAFITDMDITLGQGESADVFVTYRVNKDAGGYIIKDSDSGDEGKINIAQLGAYSIYFDSSVSTPAGLVDKDSNAGNVNRMGVGIIDTSEYEDDTFMTSLLVLVRDETNNPSNPPGDPPEPGDPPGTGTNYYRKIRGNVWEDLNEKQLSTEQVIGDGIRNTGEHGARNIVVKLMEVVKNGNDEYLVDTGISTTTDSNGNYLLEAKNRLHAGTYVVRFIYGDNASYLTTTDGNTIRYSGQDYKSTSYTDVGTETNEDEVVESPAFRNTRTANSGKIVSTAKDNELRRLEVISYSPTMLYPLDNILKSTSTTGNMNILAANTGMYADTKKFNIQIEFFDEYTDTTDFTFDGAKLVGYRVSDVNFGLIERPVTKLELMNDVSEVIATTSDGNELVHIVFDIVYGKNGNTITHTPVLNTARSVGFQNVQVLDRTGNTQGFRYVNVDSELLQGMMITIRFQLAVANTSDIDTSNLNLINMVKEVQTANIASYLRGLTTFGNSRQVYRYDGGDTTATENMLSSYSYAELRDAINAMKTSPYSNYRTYVNNVQNDAEYRSGYFLGKSYYAFGFAKTNTVDLTNDKLVETRVDQLIDYIDNDLVFKVEDNPNENGQLKFQTFTIPEIAEKTLLKGITSTSMITDGKASYITDTKNNLAFNIEDATINAELYKFLTGLRTPDNGTLGVTKLYLIDLIATRTLTSEEDAAGLSIDNLAEIIKVTNTVGRKVYVKSSLSGTGYIGNSTDTVPLIQDPTSTMDVMKATLETDSDYTEYVTFSPPTGLSKTALFEKSVVNTAVVVVIVIVIVIAISAIVLIIINRKKFYK